MAKRVGGVPTRDGPTFWVRALGPTSGLRRYVQGVSDVLEDEGYTRATPANDIKKKKTGRHSSDDGKACDEDEDHLDTSAAGARTMHHPARGYDALGVARS